MSTILFVNVYVSVSCFLIFFLRLYDKGQQSHSLPVILTCLIFVTTTFRHVFKVYYFSFIWESVSKFHEKCSTNRSSFLGKFQITIWNFPNSELQETHFHAFYPHTPLLLWRIILNYIILIFFLGCFIVLNLPFYILGWSASKIYGR